MTRPAELSPPMARRCRPGVEDAGQTSVEVALLLPVIVGLLLAIVQVGLVVQAQVLVTHAAREAARVAAVESSPDAPAAAARAAVGRGLDPSRLQVQVEGRGEPGSRVRVRLRYEMPTEVPLVGGLIGAVDLEAEATMRVE